MYALGSKVHISDTANPMCSKSVHNSCDSCDQVVSDYFGQSKQVYEQEISDKSNQKVITKLFYNSAVNKPVIVGLLARENKVKLWPSVNTQKQYPTREFSRQGKNEV